MCRSLSASYLLVLNTKVDNYKLDKQDTESFHEVSNLTATLLSCVGQDSLDSVEPLVVVHLAVGDAEEVPVVVQLFCWYEVSSPSGFVFLCRPHNIMGS